MAFSKKELQQIEQSVGSFCHNRIPDEIRDQIRMEYKINNQEILIIECRPHWRESGIWTETSIAKIRYVRIRDEWELFWQRGNLKWVKYDPLPYHPKLSKLIEEIDRDPCACFFG